MQLEAGKQAINASEKYFGLKVVPRLRESLQHKSEFVKVIVLLTVYQSTCLVFPFDILF